MKPVVAAPSSAIGPARQPISGALWQRILADAEKVFGDAKFGTELSRLGAIGSLTPTEVATGFRIAGIYGRFEYYKNLRRSAASPAYIQQFVAEGAGSDTEAINFRAKEGRERDRSFNPQDRERREADAVDAFQRLQRALGAASPNVLSLLEMLCIENRHVGYEGLIAARFGLAIATLHFRDEEKGLSRKDKRKRLSDIRRRLAASPPPKRSISSANSFKDAFIKLQQELSPHLAPEDIENVWGTLCAMKDREDFRRAKSEGGST